MPNDSIHELREASFNGRLKMTACLNDLSIGVI